MEWYEKYIGIPYKEFGRDEDGVDCYGLALLVYKNELHIDIPDYFGVGFHKAKSGKESEPLKKELQGFILNASSSWKEIEQDKAQPFDLVLFNMLGYVIHIGILIDKDTMLHSFDGKDCVCEKLEKKWRGRIYKVVRWAA